MNIERLLSAEGELRLIAFVAMLLICLVWQRWRPLRGDGRQWQRQLANLALVVIGTLLIRALFPLLAVQWAMTCQQREWGLLALTPMPGPLALLIAVVALDLAIYWQHRLFHLLPWLWRMHRVHHSDIGFDVSTGVRFHPLELMLSMAIKLAVIAALGAPPLAVLIFELMLSLGALFTHSDAALPEAWDRRLRQLVVTPSMHRIHHSTRIDEMNSNYGFHLVIWDRLFGSYRRSPIDAEQSMVIGLPRWRSAEEQRLPALLLQPFQSYSRPQDDPHA